MHAPEQSHICETIKGSEFSSS